MGFLVMQKNLVAMIPKQLTIDLNADLGELVLAALPVEAIPVMKKA